MDELRPHEPLLRDLKDWYSDIVTSGELNIKTVPFYEMKPITIGLVVEPGDAHPGIPLAASYPIDEDHRTICKPKSKKW